MSRVSSLHGTVDGADEFMRRAGLRHVDFTVQNLCKRYALPVELFRRVMILIQLGALDCRSNISSPGAGIAEDGGLPSARTGSFASHWACCGIHSGPYLEMAGIEGLHALVVHHHHDVAHFLPANLSAEAGAGEREWSRGTPVPTGGAAGGDPVAVPGADNETALKHFRNDGDALGIAEHSVRNSGIRVRSGKVLNSVVGLLKLGIHSILRDGGAARCGQQSEGKQCDRFFHLFSLPSQDCRREPDLWHLSFGWSAQIAGTTGICAGLFLDVSFTNSPFSRSVERELPVQGRLFSVKISALPLLFFSLMLGCSCARVSAAESNGFVHASGSVLVDGAGHPLYLRGINLGNWFEPEGYMFHFDGGPQSPREIEDLTKELLGPEKSQAFWREWRDDYITEPDIDLIAKSGFNSVRVPLHWKYFTSNNAEGFRVLDRLVAWAKKDGIYVILDMHCAPGGQTGTNIDDSRGYPWLYSSAEAQDQTLAVWHRIAEHYANSRTVLGYDLLNEPIPHFPRDQQFNKDLEPMYRRISAAIRSVDRNHVLILGGAQWDTNFSVFGPPFDPNTMYELHKYWMKTTDVSTIQQYLNFRAKYHVPLWAGETGENTDAWDEAFRKTLEANQVGWSFWPYKKMDATSCVVTFSRPIHWDEIIAFAKLPQTTGNAEHLMAARPPQADIDAAFADLLTQIRFDHEHLNPGYVTALGLKAVDPSSVSH